MATDAELTAKVPVKARPNRRWFQFSLRTLMVLMVVVVVSVPSGWFAYKLKQARRQQEAVRAIEKLGGNVVCFRSSSDMIPNVVACLGRLLGGDTNLYVGHVVFHHSSVTDADLVHLEGLPQLQELELGGTKVTDAGLVHLEGLTQLQTLYLVDTKVTDAGLVHLEGLKQLQTLSLAGRKVTDAGLVHLEGLTQLRTLYLVGNLGVTDAGLQHLKGLTQLQRIDLVGTNVTGRGVNELRKALPNVQIQR